MDFSEVEFSSGDMTDSENEASSPETVLAEKNDYSTNEEQETWEDVPPLPMLYPFRTGNPSLVMRMRDLEFQTSRECVSLGRGYLNMEKQKDRYAMERGSFMRESTGWKDGSLKFSKCSVCGSRTPEIMNDGSRIYCSDDCLLESYMRESVWVETSIFDLFCFGDTGTAEIGKEVLDGRAPCTVILDGQHSKYEELKVATVPEQLIRAEKGENVLVEDEKKGFLRGVIIDVNTSTYKVGLIDNGEIVDVSAVYASGQHLKKIISFGGVITFTGNKTPLSKLIKFRARERRPFGVWLCDVLESDENDVTEVVLEEWVPPLKLNPVPIPSGCSVVITQFLDARTMYVRRIDSPWNDEYVRYNNDIAAYCVKAKEYTVIPNEGEMCCARFGKDGCFYRGVVRGIEENRVIILFLDFGTEQVTELSDLRYLPALAKQVPSFCRLVRLKEVNLDSTPAAIRYLNRLTAYKCELVMTCEGNSYDGVFLMDKYGGEMLHHVICSYEIVPWVKSRHAFSKTGEVYTHASMQEVTFQCGQLEDVYILGFDEDSFRKQGIFFGTVNRSDYLGHLHGELKNQMAEFCSHLINDRYLPRTGELCMARYKGEWNRALCVEDKDIICKLTLVDRGISIWVETKNIRKILKEFLEMPALALKCVVAGIHGIKGTERENLVAYMKRRVRKAIPGVLIQRRIRELYYMTITVPPDFDPNEPISRSETPCSDQEKEAVAVTIFCPKGGITCDDVILGIKSCIDYNMLEIEEPTYHKLHTRVVGLVLEGENQKEDAKLLVEELGTIFADNGLQITCMVGGKLKLSGFGERVTKDVLVEELVEVIGCDDNEIQVTTFMQSARSRVAWVKCPLLAAIDLAEKGTIRLGQSLVKVEIQHRRPLRCFRCLREGHIGAHCSTETENSRCFRCSQMGHLAASCRKKPFCDVCAENGFPACHRNGSSSCKSRGETLTITG